MRRRSLLLATPAIIIAGAAQAQQTCFDRYDRCFANQPGASGNGNPNLIQHSEQFNLWTTFGTPLPTVTANTGSGPSGPAGTADQLSLPAAGNAGIFYVTNVAGLATFSVYIETVSGDINTGFNYFPNSTGTAVASVIAATASWVRYSLTFTGDGNASSNIAIWHSVPQVTAGVFQVWGAMLNFGATALPYQATP